MLLPVLEIGRRALDKLLILAVLGVLVALGCGTSGPDYPHARLEGAVTINDAAVESGRVHFMPAPGGGGVPVFGEISGGRYVADEVPLGKVTVTFSIAKETGKMITEGDREPYPESISIVPPHYAQGIVINVAGDNTAQDFPLTTTPTPP